MNGKKEAGKISRPDQWRAGGRKGRAIHNIGVNISMRETLRKLFYSYYRDVDVNAILPRDLPRREIAAMFWGRKGMIRHKGFIEKTHYKAYLVKNIPVHLYYSASIYKSPGRDNMDEKGYMGCDLVFDIDCDHIQTSCKDIHDEWKCKECGEEGTGLHPQSCPSCTGTVFKTKSWLCDDCLEKSKTETIKLIDEFISMDLGITLDNLEIYFSGHRGYHVHVEGEVFRSLSSESRREISDHITATGIHLPLLISPQKMKGFTLQDTGWRERITRYLLKLLDDISSNPDQVDLDKGIKRVLALQERTLRTRIEKNDRNWRLENIGKESWKKIIAYLIHEARCEIDVPVTIDIHRLIRAPGSLHGRTGFRVMELSRDELDDFDPFKDPIVFKGGEQVFTATENVPETRVGDVEFGPLTRGEQVKLPLEAAVYLELKGMGEFK
ncbi:MAG: DNA primase small subunit domain-containing protein [Promethearchaeota archaeon]